jgi:Family of unknown function (DUF5681)
VTSSDNAVPREKGQRPTRRDSELHSGRLQPGNMTAVIGRLLLNPVTITFNGQQRVVTAIEAIVLQLLRKAMEGEAGARGACC